MAGGHGPWYAKIQEVANINEGCVGALGAGNAIMILYILRFTVTRVCIVCIASSGVDDPTEQRDPLTELFCTHIRWRSIRPGRQQAGMEGLSQR